MLQIRKVIEHVYEKVMGQGSDGGSQTAGGTGTTNTMEKSDRDEEMASLADEKVELLCNDQVQWPSPFQKILYFNLVLSSI